MPYTVGFVSQKGGVGKSALARLLAREAAVNDLKVKIADLDTNQATCTKWAARRIKNSIKPEIEAQPTGDITRARAEASRYDVYIFDGAPQASRQTLEVAKVCDLVVIPCKPGLEDMEPAVELANDLFEKGIPAERIVFALARTGDSKKKLKAARAYFAKTQYELMEGHLPERDSTDNLLGFGRAPTETPFKKLSETADLLAQSLIDALERTQTPVKAQEERGVA